MKLRRLGCLLLCGAVLTGCTAGPTAPTAVMPTFPPTADAYVPPVGDAGLDYETVATLWLPSQDGQRLLAVYEPVRLTYSRHPAESIVKALLAHPGTTRVRALGGETVLSLAGTDPVVVSGGVCTVDLGPSALQLDMDALYALCMALTATLCELPDISCVNVLAAGQALSMDVMGSLPLGTLTPHPGQELPVLFEQLTARRTPVGEDPANVPLTATATLYFPLADGAGIVPEAHSLAFPGQHPQQLILTLMDAMSAGPEHSSAGLDLPDLSAMLLSAPEIAALDSGGRRVTLHFVPDVRQKMLGEGLDPACCFAALVCTLTTFVPAVQQVCIRIGDGALTSLHSTHHASLLFPGGLHTRTDYASYWQSPSVLWLASEGRLQASEIPLPYRQTHDPRALLNALAGHAPLPAGLTDADILGFSLTDDTLLVHLSERYAQMIRQSGMDQRLMAYAMVSTLCEHLPVRRVRFFFGGGTVADLGTDVIWNGEFLHNPGMLRDNRRIPAGGTL